MRRATTTGRAALPRQTRRATTGRAALPRQTRQRLQQQELLGPEGSSPVAERGVQQRAYNQAGRNVQPHLGHGRGATSGNPWVQVPRDTTSNDSRQSPFRPLLTLSFEDPAFLCLYGCRREATPLSVRPEGAVVGEAAILMLLLFFSARDNRHHGGHSSENHPVRLPPHLLPPPRVEQRQRWNTCLYKLPQPPPPNSTSQRSARLMYSKEIIHSDGTETSQHALQPVVFHSRHSRMSR